MFDNNNDPIKEYTPFRIGIDNLTDDVNSYDSEAYTDLHECSNDLSDEGSREEEIAHARFAESQRRKTVYTYTSNGNTQKIIANSGTKWVLYFFIFMFVIVPVLEVLFGIIAAIISFTI